MVGEGRGGLLAESVVWSDLVYPVVYIYGIYMVVVILVVVVVVVVVVA